MTKTVKDYRKDVDKEVSEANKTYGSSLRKKFKLVELDDRTPADGPIEKANPDDLQAAIRAAAAEVVKPLNDETAALRGSKISEPRLQMLTEKLGSCKDEIFKAKVLKDFDHMPFTNGDAFGEYLVETETDIAASNQGLADRGLSEQGKPIFGQKSNDGVPSGVASFIQSQTEEEDSLGGKEV